MATSGTTTPPLPAQADFGETKRTFLKTLTSEQQSAREQKPLSTIHSKAEFSAYFDVVLRKGKARSHMSKVLPYLEFIQRSTQFVSTMVQADGTGIASLVWGGVRLVLQVCLY